MWVNVLYLRCLDVLFPPRCAVCNTYQDADDVNSICSGCISRLRFVEEPVCAICGMEIYGTGTTSAICGDCLKRRPPFEQARSLFRYGAEVRILISKLKYNKDTSVLAALGQLATGYDLSLFDSCDYIVPVPLHKNRMQQRGFNQALLLAKVCFGKRDKRIRATVLRRTRNTVPQVSLGGKERRRSLKNVFAVNSHIDISGSSICLIDDVYTTGTTVSECARALLAGGADRVVVFTFARVAVPHRGRHDG
ncbi:MAG: ComF family protein [Desulforhopalus sp.]|jgi:ComF family protein